MEAPQRTIRRAKELRRQLTPPEARLWVALRARPGGFKFRRQHPVGPYILDFFCAASSLAIEVDGSAHDFGDNPRRDLVRDAWLALRGILVVRFPAEDVRLRLSDVVDTVIARATERPRDPLHQASPGPPPPKGEETRWR